jgi:endonuclease/exonuclease/phosphatase family metal-dependent hydrolase
MGLLIPVFVLINIFFILFWIITQKFLYLLVPFMALLIAWPVYRVSIAVNMNMEQDNQSGEERFSMLSYNVRLLDLYKWNSDKDTRDKMIAYFKKKNPTILCLQEFYSANNSKGINNIEAIQQACGYTYVSECNMHVTKRGKWGSVIFSHLPIVSSENYEIDVQGSNLLQRVDVVKNADTISVFNVHLKSNRFTNTESDLVNKGDIQHMSDSTIQQSKSIVQKLHDNSINRGLEADIISTIVAQSEYPVLICGDLNDIPISYVYFKIRNQLRDGFLEKGFGLGSTYRNRIPVLRIDYIFHDPRLQIHGFETGDLPFSDHEPLMANFSILRDELKN